MKEIQAKPMTPPTSEMIQRLAERGSTLFFPGATDSEITGLEAKLGVSFSPSYRAFLTETDGALLFQTEELFGTKDGENPAQTSVMTAARENPALPPHLIPFYRSNVSHFFDTTQVQPDQEYGIVTWNASEQAYVPVATSFPTWLESLMEENE